MAILIFDWLHWLSSLNLDELLVIVGGLLLFDAPRYTLTTVAFCIWDWVRLAWPGSDRAQHPQAYDFCPAVSVVLVGHNEADTISATLKSVWGTYPRLEILVVDDGSTDDMAEVAQQFANNHEHVHIFTRARRSGKASALNTALHYANSEVIVPVDADSDLGPSAIWEIVQPLKDPKVGAVSGAILARNPFVNLATRLQALEYLHAIFLGRMVTARMGILGIVSGAFGAFRTSELKRIGGWDVGHGEDSDLTMRLRKSGFRIAFAPYAQCFTNLPTRFGKLFKQRRRWNRGVIRHKSRKHIDMAYFWSPNFRLSNFLHLMDAWIFRIGCLFAIWGFALMLLLEPPSDLLRVLALLYLCYFVLHTVQMIPILYYSLDRRRDLRILAGLPLTPFYQLFLRCARTVSILEEIFLRRSYKDNFYPKHVPATRRGTGSVPPRPAAATQSRRASQRTQPTHLLALARRQFRSDQRTECSVY